MSDHKPAIILEDMLDAINVVMEYVDGITHDDYIHDRKTRDAIYSNIMVLGEAAYRMPEYVRTQYSNIESQKMESTRNALVHAYDKIDDRIIWNIVTRILLDVKTKLESLKSVL